MTKRFWQQANHSLGGFLLDGANPRVRQACDARFARITCSLPALVPTLTKFVGKYLETTRYLFASERLLRSCATPLDKLSTRESIVSEPQGNQLENMNYSQSGLKMTEQFEACRLDAYQDIKGIWTVG